MTEQKKLSKEERLGCAKLLMKQLKELALSEAEMKQLQGGGASKEDTACCASVPFF